MANQIGWPKCDNCGMAMRVIAGDHPTVCKNCAPPRATPEKVRADTPPTGSERPAAAKRSRKR